MSTFFRLMISKIHVMVNIHCNQFCNTLLQGTNLFITGTCIPMVHAYLWYMHTYGTCIHMVHAYLWYMHSYGTCIPMVHAYIWYMHTYGTCIHMIHAYLWYMHAYGTCTCIHMVHAYIWYMPLPIALYLWYVKPS